jgi:hypothetical protein
MLLRRCFNAILMMLFTGNAPSSKCVAKYVLTGGDLDMARAGKNLQFPRKKPKNAIAMPGWIPPGLRASRSENLRFILTNHH